MRRLVRIEVDKRQELESATVGEIVGLMGSEFLGKIQGQLISRRALLLGSSTRANFEIVRAEVPLAEMLGYSTELRSLSQGMATFSMEFAEYRPLAQNLIDTLR